MRVLLLSATIIFSMTLPTQAKSYYHRHYTHYQKQHSSYGRYLARRHWQHLNRRWAHRIRQHYSRTHIVSRNRETLPGPCHTAAAMGGPCGCWTAHVLLDRVDHVWHGINLWLANDWLKFPHVPPEQATAVVWPGRHVAPIVPGSYSNGTVTVRDYWGTHRTRTAGLVFVRSPPRHRELQTYEVAESWPL
jgi:hypothetical protein